ncbi:tetratricopeptide repeat-containing sulfotransferase family protein [Methylobacter psychrophilus]|uniref:tetratricopeptide repeat-containing sulfotransferase family protein n=1 Tax=Methylobacter psychrophilus TaxID=96941 RepID=UPI0021D5066E|nr:tetratricopeptide repeat-containing sulfotransferase family protein [Methylobacter psychrophilus]
MSQFMQLGQAAIQQKNIAEAVGWFTKALTETPKDPQVLACLGQSLCWQGQRDQGIIHLRQSGQLLLKKARKSRDTQLALDMADQLQYWHDYPGALDVCKQAVLINPGFVRGFQLLALTHSRLNQKKSALAAGRKALQLVPDSATLAILLATLEAADGLTAEAKRRLEKVLQNPSLTPEEQFRAHKELARFLDKLGEYDQVFTHLHQSADVSKRLPEVSRQDVKLVPQMLKINKAGFDHELLGRWSNTLFPADQPAPVFLLGFMRTGTTLTQEVLGANPDIFVADETDLIVTVVKELNRLSHNQGSVPDQLRKLDLAGVLHLREFYWHRAHALYGDKIGSRLLLDKTTMNTIDLGLINCIFPDAKLVFLLRDPRDVCLSCFMQTMIPTPSTVHLLSWQDTGQFYAQVMDWWMTIKPQLTMDFIEFRYEDAVFQFEPAFRKVFDFLDVNWDPAVADFHKQAAGKYIASPSFNQVAQPLYSSSVGRWRHYKAEYAEISTWLQPFISAYSYDD